ncbi:hypothetical protein BCON_0224g00130 [Botryotinia convoluta]|uniref:Uncharacterized protein n=1 Tax=Botryotinia convoluta TaxID=54673 RepID=A0A4Z1HIY0_9HELO|nr:hypothetical protein BCON_0224g00130 [Botryotinia convoluta]
MVRPIAEPMFPNKPSTARLMAKYCCSAAAAMMAISAQMTKTPSANEIKIMHMTIYPIFWNTKIKCNGFVTPSKADDTASDECEQYTADSERGKVAGPTGVTDEEHKGEEASTKDCTVLEKRP